MTRAPHTPSIEFKPSRLLAFLRVLAWSVALALAWQLVKQWLGWSSASASIGGLVFFYCIGALFSSVFLLRFRTVRVGDGWIRGPGEGLGIQLEYSRKSVTGLRRTGGRLILDGDDGESIVIHLFEHGSRADELEQHLRQWYATGTVPAAPAFAPSG